MNYLVEKTIEEHQDQLESLEWVQAGEAAKSFLGLTTVDVDDMCHELRRSFGPLRMSTKRSPRQWAFKVMENLGSLHSFELS